MFVPAKKRVSFTKVQVPLRRQMSFEADDDTKMSERDNDMTDATSTTKRALEGYDDMEMAEGIASSATPSTKRLRID